MRPVDVNRVHAGVEPTREAWLIDLRTRRDDPAGLDAEFLSAANRQEGLRPCLMAMPAPLAELERRVAAYRAAGAPDVVRICPGPDGHGYPLEAWAVSPIPEYCDAENLALIVDVGHPAGGFPWPEIVGFARAYPRLAVVAIGAPFRGPTAARALDATPNLVLETSAFVEADTADFARAVRSGGAYRFVYGSGETGLDASVVAGALDDADSEIVLAGTAGHLGGGTWALTYL